MNEERKKIYEFMLENVKEESKCEAEKLLKEGLEKQTNNMFNAEYLINCYIPKMMAMVKPKCLEHIKNSAAVLKLLHYKV